jgi:hypothetical protein
MKFIRFYSKQTNFASVAGMLCNLPLLLEFTMKNTLRLPIILGAMFLTIVSASCLAETIRAEQTTLVTVSANVKAIDYETREVTLVGGLGNEVSFTADSRIERLDEIQVGDEVIADYYVSIAGELRAPTELEMQTPYLEIMGGGAMPDGATPAGGVLRAFKVVAVVVGLDLPTHSVNLLGPRGNTGNIVVQNKDNLRALRLGDSVILTYTEALALSLQKAE